MKMRRFGLVITAVLPCMCSLVWAQTGEAPDAVREAPGDPPAASEPPPPAEAPAPIPDNGAASPDTASSGAPSLAVPADTSPQRRETGLASIQEIVVTAQKREENINDVPIAISAFSGDTLKALGAVDTRNLSNLVPGFTAADSGFNTPIYTLRGVGFNDATYTATSTVGVYVDEVNLPYSIMTKGANLDVQRVEVLKGPQGTLYGRNTTGGAINYIANKPTRDFETGINGSYARFGTADVEAFVSGPIVSSLSGRLAIHEIVSQQGWQYSNTRPGDTMGKQNKQSARATLEWTPTADFTLDFTLNGWLDRSQPQAPQAIALAPHNTITGTISACNLLHTVENLSGLSAFNLTTLAAVQPLCAIAVTGTVAPQVKNYPFISPDTNDLRVADWPEGLDFQLHDGFYQGALRAKWNISDRITSTSILSYGKVFSNESAFPQSGFDSINGEQILTAHIRSGSIETRLNGVLFDDRIHWLVGFNGSRDIGYEYHTFLIDTLSSRFPDPITGTAFFSDSEFTYGRTGATSLGVFGNADWKILDTVKFSLGLRGAEDKRAYEGCSGDSPDGQGIPFAAILDVLSLSKGGTGSARRGDCITVGAKGTQAPLFGHLDEKNLSGRTSLDWTPMEGLLFYTSYSRGFKTGGFPVLQASTQTQYTPVVQEQLDSEEIGSKTSFFDEKLHIDLAAYNYKYKNKQLLTQIVDPIFGPLPILKNAPRSKVQGVELDAHSVPLQGLFVSVSASYLRTEILEFTGTNLQGDTENYAGKPFNYAPRLQTTFLTDKTWHLSEKLDFAVGGDYSYTSHTNASIGGDPLYTLRPFGMLGARVRLADRDGRWTLLAFGRNLTDRFSTTSVFSTSDAVSRYTGQPRTYGISASYNFP